MSCLEALSPRERGVLTALATSTTGPARSVQRARALLALNSGLPEVARQVGRCPRTITRSHARFAQEGVTAVFDAARSGATPRLSAQDVLTIRETAVAEPCSVGVELQCWSLRRLSDHVATHLGIEVHHERLRQILRAHGVSKKAEVSGQRGTDPQFTQKRDAVVQLYTEPPEDRVVSMDQYWPAQAWPGAEPFPRAAYERGRQNNQPATARRGRFPGPAPRGDRVGRTRKGCLHCAHWGRCSKRRPGARMLYQGRPEPERAWRRPL